MINTSDIILIMIIIYSVQSSITTFFTNIDTSDTSTLYTKDTTYNSTNTINFWWSITTYIKY